MSNTRFGWRSGTLYCKTIKCLGDLYIQDDIIFSDVSAGSLAVTGGLDFNNVQTTSAIGIHFIDAFLGKIIETGTYQSSASGGVTLTATNSRPASFLFDDAGAAMTGNIRGVLSRIYLSVDQNSGVSINAVRGQIKVADDKDLNSANNVIGPVQGYFELAGTANRTITGHAAGVRAALEEGASGTTTISASSYYAGFEATLNSTRTYTVTGEMAAFMCNVSGGTSEWPIGLYVESALTGIELAAGTTGINISGAQAGSGILIGSTWGLGFSLGALDIGGTSTIAFGDVADSICVARYDVSAQLGVAASKYFMGEYKTYATSGAGFAGGTAVQMGIWIGDYTKLTIAHNTTDAYAVRGRTIISGAITGNQFCSMMAISEVTAAATLEATGGVYGIIAGVAVTGSGTVNRQVAAGYFSMRSNTINVAGRMSCAVADMGGSGYTDYGFLAQVGNNQVEEAAIGVLTSDSAVLPSAIQLGGASGSITHMIEFATGTCSATAETNTTFAGDGIKIAVDYQGTTYYLRAVSAFS